MKRVALILAFAALCMGVRSASLSDFFVSEPDSLFAIIDKSDRMDMVDYYHSGKKIEVANRLGGRSQIEDLSERYMKVKLSESATVELGMFVSNADTLLVAVSTVKAPAADSHLMVFDKYWIPLDAGKYFQMPGVADFLVGVSGKKKQELVSAVEFPLVSLSLGVDGSLEARPTLSDYMAEEAYGKLKPYLADRLVYQWDGKKFRLKK